jgi:peptidoglycan/LPS O-acetylase OafA/YrhL
MTSGAEEDRSASGRIKLPFRPDVEGLRGLAIILVVFSHAGLLVLRSGFVGVDVFFVLSGYLITSLLIREIELTGGLDFWRFYARRARRLLPAAMLLVIVVCLIEAIVVSPYGQFRILKAALATIFYSSNLYFAHVGLRYFEQGTALNPLLHTWSLAVEEQFYLVWPAFLLFLTRTVRTRKGMAIVFATTSAASFAFCVWLTANSPVSAFFQPAARAWEFSAGALVAFMPAKLLAQHRRISSAMGALGFIGLLVCAEFIREAAFPGSIAAVPVLCATTILMAGEGAADSPIPRLLSSQPMQALGGLSYSLYLWHWPAIVIGQQLFPSGSVAVRLLAIGVAVVLAAVTHRLVENPIRFHPYLVTRSGSTLRLAALATLISVCGLGGWRLLLNRSEQFHQFDEAARDIPVLYSQGCAPELLDAKPKLCTFAANRAGASTVVLFGDSHAAAWSPALDVIAQAQDWKLVTIVKPHCSALMIREEVSPRMEEVCDEWRRLAINEIQQLHPSLVVVANASLHPGGNGRMVTDAAVWEQAARGTFAALAQTGAQVRFIRDTPHADYNVLECLAQARWDGRTQCAAVRPAAALYSDIYAAEMRGASGLGNVGFIDLSDALCGADNCYLQVGGMIVYRDMDHLTATFSESLEPLLRQRLDDSLRR